MQGWGGGTDIQTKRNACVQIIVLCVYYWRKERGGGGRERGRE